MTDNTQPRPQPGPEGVQQREERIINEAEAEALRMARGRYLDAFGELLPEALAQQVADLALGVGLPKAPPPSQAGSDRRLISRMRDLRQRESISRARVLALAEMAGEPLVLPCPDHPEVLVAKCDHCSAFGMDQEWRERIRAVISSGSGKGVEAVPDHEVVVTFEPGYGWDADVECYAAPDADCHLVCTVPDCQAVGEIERTDEGIFHTAQDPTGESAEVTRHSMRVEEECQVSLVLVESGDGVAGEAARQPHFEVGRFPVTIERREDGSVVWARA